jgi:two-component system, OmpR family, alkaline phosphatase synthesis response regulator PhoP
MVRRRITFLLPEKEFDLLDLLVTHPGVVLAREVLLEKVWGYEFAGDSRAVDVHIRWLRGKIERDPADPRHIITVRGVGYRFEEESKMRAGCRHAVPRT